LAHSQPLTCHHQLRATFVSVNLFNLLCDGEQFATSAGGINRFGSPILYLILYGLTLFLILIWADTGAPLRLPSFLRRRQEDTTTGAGAQIPEDVQAETKAVESDPSHAHDPLRVVHVSKQYRSNRAVEDVSFGVGKDTIFAMLGPNGAGKTTTFNIIRGQLIPNTGDVFLNGMSITAQSSRARVSLGVCPQFTAIDSQLNVREHLVVYGRLKGLRGEELRKNVTTLMKATELWRYKDRLASKLSGGNQRKLALAIAMIGTFLRNLVTSWC
jgi:ATP-binding cassette, subfamily A (ABC1), member 3